MDGLPFSPKEEPLTPYPVEASDGIGGTGKTDFSEPLLTMRITSPY